MHERLWRIRFALAALLLVPAGLTSQARADKPIKAMVKVRLAGGLVEGQPLSWSESEVLLLARDGQLVNFRPESARDFRKSAPRFYSYSSGEMRSRLYAEFGNDFEVTSTQHYLVVHPPGKRALWTERFEDLYRSFWQYFRVRGFRLQQPKFPLVAIVFPTRQLYQKYTATLGQRISPNYLGHYSPATNRIYTFDITSESGSGNWSQNEATIIHEATHQAAFNTGIHRRFAVTPRWVSEGLATMFEAPGVYNASRYRARKDRINYERYADFKRTAGKRSPDSLKSLIASDRPFSSRPTAAYADAWALTFYLCETRPRKYARYLAKTASRKEFENYSKAERLKDFTSVFGDNWKMLDAQFARYMTRLR